VVVFKKQKVFDQSRYLSILHKVDQLGIAWFSLLALERQ